MENSINDRTHSKGTGKVLGGIVLLIVGVVLFARQLGADLPYWLFRWEMFLIVLGVFMGAKDSFRRNGWIVLVLIGSFFLIDDLIIDIRLIKFFWPTVILILGATMILAPNRKKAWNRWNNKNDRFDGDGINNTNDFIDSTAVLGGVKKNIVSKDFKGGEIFNVFGGTEIDLSQSDINGVVELEITQVFGGTKLILPAHWEVKSEITAVLGGIEDKRKNLSALNIADGKVLILRGTSVLGGIDIKSF
ncbi:MAG: LiaF domain-containing protein [Bacteroidota bacterium]